MQLFVQEKGQMSTYSTMKGCFGIYGWLAVIS